MNIYDLIKQPLSEDVTTVNIHTKNIVFFEGVPYSDAVHIMDMVYINKNLHFRAMYTTDGELESIQMPAETLLQHTSIYEKYPYIEIGLEKAQGDDIVHLQIQ